MCYIIQAILVYLSKISCTFWYIFHSFDFFPRIKQIALHANEAKNRSVRSKNGSQLTFRVQNDHACTSTYASDDGKTNKEIIVKKVEKPFK